MTLDARQPTPSHPGGAERRSHGIAILSTDKCFLSVSGAFAELTGYSKHALRGRNFHLLFPDYGEAVSSFEAALSERSGCIVELTRRDGSMKPVSRDLTPIRSSPQNLTGFVLKIEAISGEETVERSDYVSSFIQGARRDEALREAFTAISGAIGELADLVDRPESRTHIRIVQAAVRSGMSILEDMLSAPEE